MYQALYRKYRPNNLNDVIGQKVIVKTLSNEIKNNKISHAYLFAGPRGTGKTSVAKILAKTVNCLEPNNSMPCNKCVSCTQINLNQSTDIIEIDAASNNGVDEIRELKSKVNLVPTTSKYKVYIIDEVHMLTTGAFNALLKTLEEPPAHVIFVLATTDPQKIPTTIISRCQRFDFKKITSNEIKEALNKIKLNEEIDVNEDVINEIARLSDGGLRDSINLLDQVIAYSDGPISINDVFDVSGAISTHDIKEFIENIVDNNIKALFEKIDIYNADGKSFNKLNDEVIYYLRNIILYQNAPDYFKESGEEKIYKELSNKIDTEKAIKLIQIFNENAYILKQNSNQKLIFELSIIRSIQLKSMNNITLKEEKKTIEHISKENPLIKQNAEKIAHVKDNLEFKELKEIRINNALAGFKKEELKEIIKKSESIRSLLVIKKYSEIAKSLLDSEIKVFGNNHLIYLCEDEQICEYLNNNLSRVEQTFLKATGIEVKIISINNDEWKKIKSEFNSKTKEYKYIDDKTDVQKFSKLQNPQDDEMEDMFGNVIEYK